MEGTVTCALGPDALAPDAARVVRHNVWGGGVRSCDGAIGEMASASGRLAAYSRAIEGKNMAAGFLWSEARGMREQFRVAPIRKIGPHHRVQRRTDEGAKR